MSIFKKVLLLHVFLILYTSGAQAGEIIIDEVDSDKLSYININIPGKVLFVIHVSQIIDNDGPRNTIDFNLNRPKYSSSVGFYIHQNYYVWHMPGVGEFLNKDDVNADKKDDINNKFIKYKVRFEESNYKGIDAYLMAQSLSLFQRAIGKETEKILEDAIDTYQEVFKVKASQESKDYLKAFMTDVEQNVLVGFLQNSKNLNEVKEVFQKKAAALNEKQRKFKLASITRINEMIKASQQKQLLAFYKRLLFGGLTAATFMGLYWLSQNQERFKNLAPFLSRMWSIKQ